MLIKKKKKTRGIERYCNNNTIRDDKASTCRCKQFWHEDRNCHVKQEWFTCALFYVFNFSCLAYLFRIMIKINKRARKKTNSQSTINFNSGENRLRFPYDLPRSLPPSFSFSTSKKEEEVDSCEKFYTTFISEEFNKIGEKTRDSDRWRNKIIGIHQCLPAMAEH